MGKSKKVAVTEPEEVVAPVVPEQEGDVDPYASGVSIPNPEPNNGKGEDADQEFAQESQAVPADVPNSDADEQDEVAEGRTETPAEAEGSGEEEPAEEDPLAKEANEKAA